MKIISCKNRLFGIKRLIYFSIITETSEIIINRRRLIVKKRNQNKMIPPKKAFLRAEWLNLVMANYEVDPKILAPYLPYGTELDLWNDTCYLSLVGFMFCNTQVLGFKVPFHVNFEEVNLRFYVRYPDGNEWKRGVVFVKEIVPRAAITLIANTLYKEHYQTLPMRHSWEEDKEMKRIEYGWKFQNSWQSIKVHTHKTPQPIAEGSEAEFITEHYWGYTRLNDQKTSEYQVEHPRWNSFEVTHHEINWTPDALYGPKFAYLKHAEPLSVFMADGSEVAVNFRS